MFHFFKKKAYLADCIPTDYVDIHSHTLFGIDDGAKTLDDTNFLLNEMHQLGFGKIITTPHTLANKYPNTPKIITEKHREVCEKLPAITEQLGYHAASEYMIDEEFEEKVKRDELLTLKDNYVLVEMSFMNPPIFLDDALFLLVSKGYTPVMAHPERYNFYHGNDLKPFQDLKKMGCKLQLNLLASVGYYGDHVTQMAQLLLKNNLYDFVGSDIHHQKHLESFKSTLKIKDQDALRDLAKNNQFFK